LNAIGPDAVTVRGEGLGKESTSELESLPLMSDVIGHKMVTQSGRLIGAIDDILIDAKDGTIIGFAVGAGVKSKLESVFNPDRARFHGYVRADADLQVGNDLIVIPDDAFVEGDLTTRVGEKERPAAIPAQPDVPPRGWAEERPSKADKSGIWKRRTKADDTGAAHPRAGDAAAEEPGRRFSSVPSEPHNERTGLKKEVDWPAPSGGAETSR
jgi:sporulation protein YlmC with PRC-barrel domain